MTSEPSDAKLAHKFGVSRTTVWRIRHEELSRQAKLKRAKARLKSKEEKMQTQKRTAAVAMKPLVPQPMPATVAVAPKVDAEPVVMGTYFAVQLLRCEGIKDVAKAVMQAAEARGVLFRKLQVMDSITVGTSTFVRFRSDLVEVAAVLAGVDRGFVSFADGNYRFTFPDGRQGGKFPTSLMLSVQKPGFGAVFAGPKILRWSQQFATAS